MPISSRTIFTAAVTVGGTGQYYPAPLELKPRFFSGGHTALGVRVGSYLPCRKQSSWIVYCRLIGDGCTQYNSVWTVRWLCINSRGRPEKKRQWCTRAM